MSFDCLSIICRTTRINLPALLSSDRSGINFIAFRHITNNYLLALIKTDILFVEYAYSWEGGRQAGAHVDEMASG
jgi:hypothetical protein